MRLPKAATYILEQLNRHGYEAYAVGGAVRDGLRGLMPDDVDITTSASPEEVARVFSHCKTVPTGLPHGTLTVLIDHTPFEITTYRTDGPYSDGRHPDSVSFTSSLTEDLARRDFTVNAMAYHPQEGLIDPFGGKEDLRQQRLRCVGDPQRRFKEDALRMARLLRFMSVLSFSADDDTLCAAHALCGRLSAVAAERKRTELSKALLGDGIANAALALPDVTAQLMPPLAACVGFSQHNPHHDFDVYEHTLRAVSLAPPDLCVRLALLLHDVGKPLCFTRDEQGVGHFYKHPSQSERLAAEALKALRFDNKTIDTVLPLIKAHDLPITAERRLLKRYLHRFGEDNLRRLLHVKAADAAACHRDGVPPDFSEVYAVLQDILQAKECVSLSSLAIDGTTLLSLGYPKGPLIGTVLRALLDEVLNDTLANDREALISYVKERWPL